ncbi:hypothetical protein DENSPDRAFT_238121 [Dentipellis sp. KUC8613]|nr:hypothetical protein DENSPDRAFT_238121 [Dentipellis sp. KUC8613]
MDLRGLAMRAITRKLYNQCFPTLFLAAELQAARMALARWVAISHQIAMTSQHVRHHTGLPAVIQLFYSYFIRIFLL